VTDTEHLVFNLGGQLYALPVRQVSSVVPRASLAPVAGAPDDVIGVLRLRGELLPIVDLRAVLGLPILAPQTSDCIIVTRMPTLRVGLLAEGVEGLATLVEQQARPRRDRLVSRIVEASGRVVTALDANAVMTRALETYVADLTSDGSPLGVQAA
jgi:chemotaxis signal transduction protein